MDEIDIILKKLDYPKCKETITYEEILGKLTVNEVEELYNFVNKYVEWSKVPDEYYIKWCREHKNFIQAVITAYDNRNRKFKPQELNEKNDFSSSDELRLAINECLSNPSIPKQEKIDIIVRLMQNEKMTPQIHWDVFDSYSKLFGVDKTIDFITSSKVVLPDILIKFLKLYGWDLNAEQIIRIVNSDNAEARVLAYVVERYYGNKLNKDKIDFNIVRSVLEKAKNNPDKEYVSLGLFIEIIRGEEWYSDKEKEIPNMLENGFLNSDRVNAKVMETIYNLYKKRDADSKKASDLNQPYLFDWDKYEIGMYSSSDFYGFESKIAALSSLVMDDTGDSTKAKKFIEGFLGKEYASLYDRCKAERLASLSEEKNPSSR